MLLKIGDQAPQFNLQNQDGDNISLESLKGERFILWFYPKASTPGWTVEGQGFRDELNKFIDLNIKVFGVSADSVKRQKNFYDKQKFNFSLLSDEEHTMLKPYGVWGLKKFMGKEYMGIIRKTFTIDEEGKISQIIDKVKTKEHTSQILD